MTYNLYNLAEEMHQEGRLQARYTWLADSTKLAMVDGDGSGYAYIGSLVYRNDKGTLSLESCSFGAGRIAVSMVGVTKTTVPYYYLTDHLGSTTSALFYFAPLPPHSYIVDEAGNQDNN